MTALVNVAASHLSSNTRANSTFAHNGEVPLTALVNGAASALQHRTVTIAVPFFYSGNAQSESRFSVTPYIVMGLKDIRFCVTSENPVDFNGIAHSEILGHPPSCTRTSEVFNIIRIFVPWSQ